jgi:hypothetical protein
MKTGTKIVIGIAIAVCGVAGLAIATPVVRSDCANARESGFLNESLT